MRRTSELAKYVELLRHSPAEARSLHEETLIHVTSFFREPQTFEDLKAAAFEPFIKSRAPQAPIRIWVPGCSTGEEVYSLAIALCEFLEEKGVSFPLQIFGTDVSEKVVSSARQGRYANPEVPAKLLAKYFNVTEDGQYQVVKALRELCVFAAHDLGRDPPYSNLDLVSCRNVLIYFDQALQERVVPVFHYALNPAGFLMLGPSESIDAFKDLFSSAERSSHIFSKKAVPSRLPLDMLAGGRAYSAPGAEAREAAPPAWSLSDLTKEADRIVLTTSCPGVIVSEELDILQFRGDVGPFLTPSPGKASFNLGKMAHEGLLSPVTRALEQARKTRIPAVLKSVEVKDGTATRVIQVQVIPISGSPGRAAYFLVLFADPAAAPPQDAETLEAAEDETRERRLERELQATRRTLEAIIDKQQTAAEEVQSANEELRSRNEEYQSSLEELQTAHEELQSANEELATLNDELRKRTTELDQKNAELGRANEELRKAGKIRGWLAAIVDSSDDAIVSKDLNGVITSWNQGAERLFGFSEDEAIGKLITIIIPPDRLDEEPRILAKLRRGERISHFETVRRRKDRTLLDISATISPIFDANGALVGISKVARDITDRKRAGQRLEQTVAERTIELRASNEELEAFCYSVAHDLRAPLRRIASYAQLIERRVQDSPDGSVRKDFQKIIDNATGMSQLIDGLLNLSRLTRQELKTERVDLSALVDGLAKELKRTQPERDVRFVVEPGLRVRGDANLLRSLLQNLLENAWKFTAKHPRARIEFGAVPRGGELVYFVRDDGAGFEAAHAGNLFNAFQRLHRDSEFSGSGIGLATAKRIVMRHGGRIWAEGAVEKGAAFFFTVSPDVLGRAEGSS
ncbi:MAG TPA: CheR family methyltransferase [Elusimicrobiota bacterium]|nr:CheR family methyltransferase [Elusimicrobiota bacterium]